MTFREKLAKEHPECVRERSMGGCTGCPLDYGYEQERNCNDYNEASDINCRRCWDREIPTEKAYEEGLHDAWELARKIAMEKSNGGFDIYEIVDIFGFNDMDAIFMSYTPQEAIAKLKAYEEEKEEKRKAEEMAKIKVGDVVETDDGTKYVVLDVLDEEVALFSENGCVEQECEVHVTKTGKHIDIESLLGQIRGE